jgi:arylamine N-acetyltransferase
MVNLVTISGQRYLVDVGFGRGGPVVPLPLIPNHETAGWGTQRLKLEHRAVAQHTDRSQRLWVYSNRADDEASWTACYAFSELEFFPADFRVMNLSTMMPRTSWFTQQVTCCCFLTDADGKEVKGIAILFANRVRRMITGQPETVEELESEAHRLLALEEWFGIRLDAAERRGIRGLSSELKDAN